LDDGQGWVFLAVAHCDLTALNTDNWRDVELEGERVPNSVIDLQGVTLLKNLKK
jgi:hypothetical protein